MRSPEERPYALARLGAEKHATIIWFVYGLRKRDEPGYRARGASCGWRRSAGLWPALDVESQKRYGLEP